MPSPKPYDALRPPPKPPIKVKPTPRLLELLDFMQDYDVLPRTYISDAFPIHSATRNRLAEATKAHLIGIPDGWSHREARNCVRPLQLQPLGFKMLKDAGLFRPHTRSNAWMTHAYLSSVVDFSFRRAAVEIPDLAYVTEDQLQARSNWVKTDTDPIFSALPLADYTVYPDGFFGLNYSGLTTMYFHREDDTGGERIKAKATFRKKSIEKMIQHYKTYLEARMCTSRYNIKQVTILITTTKAGRVKNILDIIRAVCPEPLLAKRFAVTSITDFLTTTQLPPATGHLVTAPWMRVDGPFSIIDTLKATAEKRAA